MKLSTFSLALVLLAVVSTVARAQWPVQDYSGAPVEIGKKYDLWGVGEGRGPIAKGALVGLSDLFNYVINRPNQDPPLKPDAVIFYPAKQESNNVLYNRDTNIIFADGEEVYNTWMVNIYEGAGFRNVITGGTRGDPSCGNEHSYFQLKPFDYDNYLYNIVYNPQVCSSTKVNANVTSVWGNNENRLYVKIDNSVAAPAINIRLTPHQPTIRQVVDGVKW